MITYSKSFPFEKKETPQHPQKTPQQRQQTMASCDRLDTHMCTIISPCHMAPAFDPALLPVV